MACISVCVKFFIQYFSNSPCTCLYDCLSKLNLSSSFDFLLTSFIFRFLKRNKFTRWKYKKKNCLYLKAVICLAKSGLNFVPTMYAFLWTLFFCEASNAHMANKFYFLFCSENQNSFICKFLFLFIARGPGKKFQWENVQTLEMQ